MGKIKLIKILYILILPLVFAVVNAPVFAIEEFQSEEIIPAENTKEQEEDELPVYENFLGEEHKGPPKETDEFIIPNPLDAMRAKKAKKAAVKKEEPKEEEPALVINCVEMEYFEEKNELEARGNVKITTKEGAKAEADEAVYNKELNTIKLINNVVLTKNGTTTTGDYMFVDLNEENAIMDEPITIMGNIKINAQEGFAYSDRIENLNGNVELNQRVEMELASLGFTKYGRSINDSRLVDFSLKKERSKPYSFRTKEIIIRPERDHDSMLMKDVDIYYKNHKIMNTSSIEFFTDKEMTYEEINYPLEFGSLKGFGMYLGMGYTFKLPKTYTLRVTPAVVYGDNEFGIGAMAQLKSQKTRFEAGWNSATNNLILDADWKIAENWKLDFGRHAYKGEWFNGGTRAGYIGELAFDKSYIVKDLANSVFRHRVTAGYVADYYREHQEDNMHDGFRYRYMAELRKNIKTYGNKEQDMYLTISALAQTMATIYSQGDTVGVFRMGPAVSSRVKRWNSTIQYTFGGVHGQTPYYFDEYRYGRQSISFDESLILNRFLSVGYRGTLTPLEDNRAGDLVTENRFYAVAGPEDFKIAFSYDTIRQNMHFDFLFLLGSDNLDLRYEKLTINDPDKLGKHQRRMSDKELNRVAIPEDL